MNAKPQENFDAVEKTFYDQSYEHLHAHPSTPRRNPLATDAVHVTVP